MNWRIEQQGDNCWMVYKGDERHWAQTAKDAVELKRALDREDIR